MSRDRIHMLCLHRSIAISFAAPCCMCNLYMLRHLHVVHGLSCPLAWLSSRLTEVQWGVWFVLLSHSLHLMTLGGKFAGFTECRKQFLDFKRLSAGILPCKEWASFISCLSFSTLVHTPDTRWRNSRQQVQFLYISWFETSRDCSACTIEL